MLKNRVRFVMLGACVVAAVLFVPDAIRHALEPVPTEHQPALMLEYDRFQINAVYEQILALESVQSIDLDHVSADPAAEPIVSGIVNYDGFFLFWRTDDSLQGFDTLVRPGKRRFASEPDPEQIDAALVELEALFRGMNNGDGLFITHDEMRGVSGTG